MSDRKQRIKIRNEKIRCYINTATEKKPQWKLSAIIDEASEVFFLSPRTVEAILKYEGTYAEF